MLNVIVSLGPDPDMRKLGTAQETIPLFSERVVKFFLKNNDRIPKLGVTIKTIYELMDERVTTERLIWVHKRMSKPLEGV